MSAESGGHPTSVGRPITSRAGAMGLMQLMPQTWAALRGRYGFGLDPYVPRDNIFAGAAYLRALYIRYGYPQLFAAYNAGPRRVDASLFLGAPLPAETRTYLARLGQPVNDERGIARRPGQAGLFFALQTPTTTPGSIVPHDR